MSFIQEDLEEETEDISGLAGWMYSDLLVGLMVIFLATITFVPQGSLFSSGGNFTNESTIYTYSKVVDKPLTLLIDDEQIPNIPMIVDDFKIKNNLSTDATIVYLQIVGSYNDKMESPEQAVSRALSLSQKLEERYEILFKNASTTFSRTTTIPSNQVVIRMIFAEKVTVGNGSG
jgi:hypothetical protein